MGMQQITARGLTFDVRVGGPADGEPVLLLHGFPQNGDTWGAVVERLHAAGLRTIAPDQRGYSPGARPSNVEAYRVTELTDDAAALLDALEIESAHVIGHDWGAVVAWNLAGRQPERVRTLTAVSVPHPIAAAQAIALDPHQQQLSSYMSLFRQDGTAENMLLADGQALLTSMLTESGLTGPYIDVYTRYASDRAVLTGGLNWYRAMTLLDLEGLEPITCPVTYIWGDQDRFFGRFAAERCAEHVTGPYRLAELPGGTHWIPELQPETVAKLVIDRVASLQH